MGIKVRWERQFALHSETTRANGEAKLTRNRLQTLLLGGESLRILCEGVEGTELLKPSPVPSELGDQLRAEVPCPEAPGPLTAAGGVLRLSHSTHTGKG